MQHPCRGWCGDLCRQKHPCNLPLYYALLVIWGVQIAKSHWSWTENVSEFEKPLILCTTWFHASMKFSKMDNIRHSRVAIIWYYQCIIWNIDDINFRIKSWLHSEGLVSSSRLSHIYIQCVSNILQIKRNG